MKQFLINGTKIEANNQFEAIRKYKDSKVNDGTITIKPKYAVGTTFSEEKVYPSTEKHSGHPFAKVEYHNDVWLVTGYEYDRFSKRFYYVLKNIEKADRFSSDKKYLPEDDVELLIRYADIKKIKLNNKEITISDSVDDSTIVDSNSKIVFKKVSNKLSELGQLIGLLIQETKNDDNDEANKYAKELNKMWSNLFQYADMVLSKSIKDAKAKDNNVKDDAKDVKVCLSNERYAVVSTKEWRIWKDDAYADFTTNIYTKAKEFRDMLKYDAIIIDCYNSYNVLDSVNDSIDDAPVDDPIQTEQRNINKYGKRHNADLEAFKENVEAVLRTGKASIYGPKLSAIYTALKQDYDTDMADAKAKKIAATVAEIQSHYDKNVNTYIKKLVQSGKADTKFFKELK